MRCEVSDWWRGLVRLVEDTYMGTSLIRNSAPPGPYSRTLNSAPPGPYSRTQGPMMGCVLGGGLCLMSEVTLYPKLCTTARVASSSSPSAASVKLTDHSQVDILGVPVQISQLFHSRTPVLWKARAAHLCHICHICTWPIYAEID